jgi:uncharacterized membrane protein YoaK (UPF0700 family)
MRRYLPGRFELLMFAILALICGAIVSRISSLDAGLSILTFPIFLFAAILGLLKSDRFRSADLDE